MIPRGLTSPPSLASKRSRSGTTTFGTAFYGHAVRTGARAAGECCREHPHCLRCRCCGWSTGAAAVLRLAAGLGRHRDRCTTARAVSVALRPGTQDFDWYEPVTARWVVLAVLLAPLFALVWL